jgi:hypothetical protein
LSVKKSNNRPEVTPVRSFIRATGSLRFFERTGTNGCLKIQITSQHWFEPQTGPSGDEAQLATQEVALGIPVLNADGI